MHLLRFSAIVLVRFWIPLQLPPAAAAFTAITVTTGKTRMSSSSALGAQVVALNVKFVAKSDQAKSRLLDLLIKDQKGTYGEEGALQFTIGIDTANPLTIHLHEQYTSQEALDKHTTEPHFKNFIEYTESTDEPLAEPPTITAYSCKHGPVRREPLKETYCLNVESCIRPEIREDFVELMQQHQKDTLAEARCLQFDWGEKADEPNSFYIHEEYTGKEGYKAHEATAHFARFMRFNADKKPYSKPQVVSFFKTVVS